MLTRSNILADFIKNNKLTLAFTFVVSLFSNLFTIIIPISIGKFYNLTFGLNTHRSQVLDFLPAWFWDTSPRFLTFFLVLIFLKLLFDFLQQFQVGRVGEKMLLYIRGKLFYSQLYMPMQVYDEKGIGKYLLRHSGDLKSIQNYVTKGLVGFSVDMLLLGLVFTTIGILNAGLAVIMAVFLPIFGVLMTLLNRALHSRSLAQRNYKSGLLSFVNATLRGILSLKAFNRLAPEMSRYVKRSTKVYEAGIRYHQVRSVIMAVIPGLLYLMLFAILYYTYYRQQQGQLSLDAGSLLTAILLLVTAMPVFRRTLRVNTVWELGKISFSKLLLVLNQPADDDRPGAEFKFNKGEIAFEEVKFKYTGAQKSIIYEDCFIHSNSLTRVYGHTGSGKTTLLKLLIGVYLPTGGKILVDSQDIKQVTKKSLRKCISVVPGDWPIYGKTVFEAISYSRKADKRPKAEVVLERVQSSCPAATRLTLDTRIGDLGCNLSKGQKKLLAFARALLSDKPILIIDEPFSGLDIPTQVHLSKLILELKDMKTIIVLEQDAHNEYLPADYTLCLGKNEIQEMVDTR